MVRNSSFCLDCQGWNPSCMLPMSIFASPYHIIFSMWGAICSETWYVEKSVVKFAKRALFINHRAPPALEGGGAQCAWCTSTCHALQGSRNVAHALYGAQAHAMHDMVHDMVHDMLHCKVHMHDGQRQEPGKWQRCNFPNICENGIPELLLTHCAQQWE